jgi:hypothetical protein
MEASGILYFGSTAPELGGLVWRKSIGAVIKAAASGSLRALVVDARSADDFFRAQELLRTLYDDPRRPKRLLHPSKVLALISDSDVEAAFTLGRYGIAGVLTQRSLAELQQRLGSILQSKVEAQLLPTPVFAPSRSTRLGARAEGELPTVTIGYRHAPQTLDALERYQGVLAECGEHCTVFADVATLIRVMVNEGLTCQTNLAAKAGAMHTGQFIGSFAFYRELRRTRYGRIPEHPAGAIAMDVFIAVDEIVHEVLHLLFLANQFRAGIVPTSVRFAEELSVTWWQAVVHNRVFPEWLADRHILEINNDFLLSEQNQESRKFWQQGNVFDQYLGYPWVPYVLSHLPERPCYIGDRADLAEVVASFAAQPETAFLLSHGTKRLRLSVPFDAYPEVPKTLRVVAA